MSIKLTDADHLEPCALCGNREVTIEQKDDNIVVIKCKNCGLMVSSYGLYPAIQNWNRPGVARRPKIETLEIHNVLSKERVMTLLWDYITDINPAEIASQIESDSLGNWCEHWKDRLNEDMRSVLNEAPFVAPDSSNHWHYVNDSTYLIPFMPVLVRCEWESEDGTKKSYMVVAELKEDGQWIMSVVNEPIHDKVVAWKSIS